MQVTVSYFATLRLKVGVKQETLTLPEAATVADLKAAILLAHPELADSMTTVICAVNREFAAAEDTLKEGDEAAFFPPVSGGGEEPPTVLRLTQDPLDLNQALGWIVRPTTGAACVFAGLVRARTERGEPHTTEALEYEAYSPMAEAKLHQVVEELRRRWPSVEGVAIVQRIGRMEAGTPTVLVACSAAHRDSGVFEAARYGIDRLKEIVPIWKKDIGPEGEAWVEGNYHPGPGDRST